MGKFVGLVGAMTTVGAMAYLMAPLPQSATSPVDRPARVAATTDAVSPPARVAAASKTQSFPPVSREPAPNLVQQIQAELHRLGCYDGEIDGKWSAVTRRAMQTLGERVSVLRPVDTPDYIMLALARDQTGTVCATTQRTAEADVRDRRTTETATEVTGRGAVRPTSAATRVAATPEPERPSAASAPRVWRAVPEASHKRTVARSVDPSAESARLKAEREELSKRTAVAAPAIPPIPSVDDPASAVPDVNRMSLGVGPGDPLQAYTDPRNPNAPAILRAPPQPQPRVALQAGEQPAIDAPAPAPVAQAAPPPPAVTPSAPPPARVARRESTRDWRRNVFNEMRFNGP